MWPSEDEDNDVDEAGNGESTYSFSKVELVNGLIKAVRPTCEIWTNDQRKQLHTFETLSNPHSSSLDVPFTPRHSSASSLTSPPSSSDESGLIKDMEIDATPKAPVRTRNYKRVHETAPDRTGLGNVPRKERKHKVLTRPKGVSRRDMRRARFESAVKSPEQKTTRLMRTRSSTVSSQYATTSDGSNASAHDVDLRPRNSRQPSLRVAMATSSVERATPIIRRLRPRTRGSVGSSASTEVDADQEDNADEEPVSGGSSYQLQQSESVSTREMRDRRAKREALRALQADDASSDMDTDHDQYSPSANNGSNKPSLRGSSSSARRTRKSPTASSTSPSDDAIEIDSPSANGSPGPSSRTTRSGRAFGDIQDRSGSSNDLDDSMDEDNDEFSGWAAGKSCVSTHADA